MSSRDRGEELLRETERALSAMAAMVRRAEDRISSLDEIQREHSKSFQDHRTSVEVRFVAIERDLAHLRQIIDENRADVKGLADHRARVEGGSSSIKSTVQIVLTILAVVASIVALFK